jgi:predicted acylesterase/phospholipase RssA
MSLSGFIPPLSDNGNLLVDGGYLNNLPGDVMKGFGAEFVIMVDGKHFFIHTELLPLMMCSTHSQISDSCFR